MEKVRDYLKEQHAEQRREEARQKKAEKRAAQRAAKRVSNERNKGAHWIIRFDNCLHNITGQPRNY
jgi:hypothetical protein